MSVFKKFIVGQIEHTFFGVLNIRMPVADDMVIVLEAHIVLFHGLLLLWLNILRQLELIFNCKDESLQSDRSDWKCH